MMVFGGPLGSVSRLLRTNRRVAALLPSRVKEEAPDVDQSRREWQGARRVCEVGARCLAHSRSPPCSYFGSETFANMLQVDR